MAAFRDVGDMESTRGSMYERLANKALCHGLTGMIRKASETEGSKVVVGAFKSRSFQSSEDLEGCLDTQDVYYKPVRSNYPAIASFIVLSKESPLLQYLFKGSTSKQGLC